MKPVRVMCRHCRQVYDKKKPEQKYCGKAACQKARKRRWARETYARDPDYRLNQKESTEAWLKKQGGPAQYHREYRREKRQDSKPKDASKIKFDSPQTPAFIAPALEEDVPSDSENSSPASLFAPKSPPESANANRDAHSQDRPIKSGIYEIFSANANRDARLVEIRFISGG